MYLSAKYIDVKLKQDYADFVDNEEQKALVLCDGIGEFEKSGIVAKTVVDVFIENKTFSTKEIIRHQKLNELKATNLNGGTTIVSALIEGDSKKIKIEYLGNGGIIHLYGDFNENPNSELPHRYAELMLPHIAPNGALTKHISHDGAINERSPSKLELELNYITGDIMLFFTDGISSLEDKIILQDGEKRYWRNENPAIQIILKELDIFLKDKYSSNSFNNDLVFFNTDILRKLKSENYLEDDASLGIIITENVLKHYKRFAND